MKFIYSTFPVTNQQQSGYFILCVNSLNNAVTEKCTTSLFYSDIIFWSAFHVIHVYFVFVFSICLLTQLLLTTAKHAKRPRPAPRSKYTRPEVKVQVSKVLSFHRFISFYKLWHWHVEGCFVFFYLHLLQTILLFQVFACHASQKLYSCS